MVQTLDGYIWFGTSDGLVRFDRVRFTVFNKANSANFPNNRLSYVQDDRSGRLWCVTEDGILFYYRNGSFTIVKPQNDPWFGMAGEVQDDGAGSVLVWSNKQDRTFQFRDGALIPYEIPVLPALASPLASDRDGSLWFRLQANVYQYRSGQLRTFMIPDPEPMSNTDVMTDRAGNIWFARDHEERSVYRFRNGVFSKMRLPLNRIWGMTEDRFGNMWFASYNAETRSKSRGLMDDLTPAERKILGLIAEFKSTKEIADQLFISNRTVDNHRSDICQNLGVTGTNALLKFVAENKRI